MVVNIPARLTPHTVQVEDFLAESSTGTVRRPAREVPRAQYTTASEEVVGPDGKLYRTSARCIIREAYGPIVPGTLVTPPTGGAALRVLTVGDYTGFPTVEGFYDCALVVDRRG